MIALANISVWRCSSANAIFPVRFVSPICPSRSKSQLKLAPADAKFEFRTKLLEL